MEPALLPTLALATRLNGLALSVKTLSVNLSVPMTARAPPLESVSAPRMSGRVPLVRYLFATPSVQMVASAQLQILANATKQSGQDHHVKTPCATPSSVQMVVSALAPTLVSALEIGKEQLAKHPFVTHPVSTVATAQLLTLVPVRQSGLVTHARPPRARKAVQTMERVLVSISVIAQRVSGKAPPVKIQFAETSLALMAVYAFHPTLVNVLASGKETPVTYPFAQHPVSTAGPVLQTTPAPALQNG